MKAFSTKAILRTGLLAGTSDILGAIFVYAVIMGKTTAVQILQSIASGVFGKEAFTGGIQMAIYGLIFHYFIATTFATAYFWLFPQVSFLRNQKIVSGLLYGVVVWIVMNLGVLPLSNVSHAPLKLSSILISMGILMLCIGLPISLLVHQYYTKQK